MQKGTKWLVGAVAALVVINIALVATIWLKRDEGAKPPRGDARAYLVKELDLDKEQEKSFDSLRTGHFERMNEYKKKMRFVKDKLFTLLSLKEKNEAINNVTNELAENIGELQKKIDLETFEHFAALRSLLDEEQAKKFDTTIQAVLHTMGPGPDVGAGPPPHHLKEERNGPPPPANF